MRDRTDENVPPAVRLAAIRDGLDRENFLAELAARKLEGGAQVRNAARRYRGEAQRFTRVDFNTGHSVGDHETFQYHPLTAEQVAATARILGERYPVYELLAYFLPYSGLRKAECAGLEIQDLEFTTRPGQPTRCTVHVRRTKDRKGGSGYPAPPSLASRGGRCRCRRGWPSGCWPTSTTTPAPTSPSRPCGPAGRTAGAG